MTPHQGASANAEIEALCGKLDRITQTGRDRRCNIAINRFHAEITDEAAQALRTLTSRLQVAAEALEPARDILERYIGFLHRMPASEIELHPYIPTVEDAFDRASAAHGLITGKDQG